MSTCQQAGEETALAESESPANLRVLFQNRRMGTDRGVAITLRTTQEKETSSF